MKMINLKVDKNNVEQNIDGRLTDIMTELIIGATTVLKSISVNADMYTDLRSVFIGGVTEIEYDEIEEAIEDERKSNDL